jgi:imidazolonepropionase-like amidohydrolase
MSIFVSMTFYNNIGRIVTPMGKVAVRAEAMNRLYNEVRQAILVDNGVIVAISGEDVLRKNLPNDVTHIDCKGLLALPGFVDSHTHAVFM